VTSFDLHNSLTGPFYIRYKKATARAFTGARDSLIGVTGVTNAPFRGTLSCIYALGDPKESIDYAT
jgi:hypothetical protein